MRDRQYQESFNLPPSDTTRDHAAPVLEAELLFGQARQVAIRHAGEVYVLRCTKQNKLLLTKPAETEVVKVTRHHAGR